jgi:voltage-gated potassium channel
VLPRRLIGPLLVPVVLLVGGTVGYRVIEGPTWSWFDAFYMTSITLTTVGFLEVHELSIAGRMFTVFLCFGGIFTLFYTATEFIRAVVSGELREALGRQRMEEVLGRLKDHIVVCGYGRMGRFVCEQFERQRLRYVVIDRRPDLPSAGTFVTGIPLVGDATSDEVLKHAGVARAKALITVLSSDADNLYITLSARLLNERLTIVARAEEADAQAKLTRVGANRVVSPYLIGGARVAQAVLRPAVLDFIELATQREHLDLQIEETALAAGSRLVGRTLEESQLRQDLGVIVVAVKRPGGEMVFNPPGYLRLEAGDTLIALGHRQNLDRLDELAGSGR